MKKTIKIIFILYLLIGVLSAFIDKNSFIDTISIYNLNEQINNLDYFTYCEELIKKPVFVDGSQKEKDFKTIQLICESDSLNEYLNQDNHSFSLLFSKLFAYTLPFVIVLILFIQKNKKIKKITILFFIYLITSITYFNNNDNKYLGIKRYFEKVKIEKVKSHIDSMLNN